MQRSRWLQTLIVLLVFIAASHLAGVVWQLGQRFADIILPFFLAWLVAFTLNPLADALVRRRVSRPLAIGIVYLTLVLLFVIAGFLIAPTLTEQSVQLGQSLPALATAMPDYYAGVQAFLDARSIPVRLSDVLTEAALVTQAQALGTALAQNALVLAQGIAATAINTVIVLILSFYFMLDGERFEKIFVDVLPDAWSAEAKDLLESVDLSFGGFMRGLLIQAAVYGVGTGMIMALAGLPYIVVVSVFAGLIMIIPFVGSIIALLPPIILAGMNGDWVRALIVFVALMLLQQLVFNVIAPKIMSDAVGMHPLLIFAALLFGAKELGILGAIFGVPIVGVIWSMGLLFYNRKVLRRDLTLAELREDSQAESVPGGYS